VNLRATTLWARPTLRLRLTAVNAVLLIIVSGLLLVVAWLAVAESMDSTSRLQPGSAVVRQDGTVEPAEQWQREAARAAERELLMRGTVAVLVVMVIGGGVGYLVVTRALRPLHRVTATARRLSEETLDERIRHIGPNDEVAELANTFDAMLDRLNTSFDSQRRFVANASHELRTPLTVMRTEIEVTLADKNASVEDLRRMGAVVQSASERANALVDALLVLARSEAQAGRQLARKDPADLCDGVTLALSAVQNEIRRLGLQVTSELEPAPVIGDPSLLARLAGNLIENAVRYNHLQGTLSVRTGSDSVTSWLEVRNSGFEVEPGEVAGLFEPFRRGGRERTGARGSGLGLSIVRAVCTAHGGTVAAVAQPGGGLAVTVTLPRGEVSGSRGSTTGAGIRGRR
jgi:signal transduction histidine kinase